MLEESLEHSVEYYVEKAFLELFEAVFAGWKYDVAFRSFVAMQNLSELPDEVYPAIEIIADPYSEMSDGCGFGDVSVRIVSRVYVDDSDPCGIVVDKINANATANIDLASLIEYADDSIDVKGLVKVKQTSAVFDGDSRTREKTVTYSVYIASLQKA
jgi:hypothetical protein